MASPITVTISAEHPALAGHFPGVPILPGVVLLDETLRALETDAALGARRWRIGRAKFLKPVHPGETLEVAHEQLPNGSVRFCISSSGQAVAEGMLLPAGSEPGDGHAAG